MQENVKQYRWDAICDRLSSVKGPILAVEVGVYKAALSTRLLKMLPNLKLDLVDRWCETPPGDSYFEGSLKMSRFTQAQFDEVFHDALRNIQPYADRVTIYKLSSVEASKYIPDNSRHLIFIDADHSRAGVLTDLKHWVPKVIEGGWVCGHDWDHPEQGDVKGAVEEFFPNRLSDIELGPNRTWFLRL